MNKVKPRNLDKISAEYGFKVVNKLKDNVKSTSIINMANKSIGILQENGIYAYFIWLDARTNADDKEVGKELKQISKKMLVRTGFFDSNRFNVDRLMKKIGSNFDQMVFIKQLIQSMLTYALYRAKGLANSEGEKDE